MAYRPESLQWSYDKQLARLDPENVMIKFESSKSSLPACEWACRALASITLCAAEKHDMDLQCRLLDLGICENLIDALSVHGAESSIVAAYGCQTLRNLAFDSRDFREFLGTLSLLFLPLLLFSFRIHFLR